MADAGFCGKWKEEAVIHREMILKGKSVM